MDHPPYAGRDTINTGLNTFKRIDPGLVENAGNKIDKVTKKILQIMSQGGKELERVTPIIHKEAIGQLYRTPFGLLGKFARNNINSALRN